MNLHIFLKFLFQKVYWTSPPKGHGCIDFKAMVVERADVWYMDDGALTYSMCEDDAPLSEPQVNKIEKVGKQIFYFSLEMKHFNLRLIFIHVIFIHFLFDRLSSGYCPVIVRL